MQRAQKSKRDKKLACRYYKIDLCPAVALFAGNRIRKETGSLKNQVNEPVKSISYLCRERLRNFFITVHRDRLIWY